MSAWTIFIIFMYFVPTFVATKADRAMVCVVNLFTGWTIIGWVVALAMAVRPQHKDKS
jgi:hypothetical protein